MLLSGIFKKRLADGRGETLFEIGYDGKLISRVILISRGRGGNATV